MSLGWIGLRDTRGAGLPQVDPGIVAEIACVREFSAHCRLGMIRAMTRSMKLDIQSSVGAIGWLLFIVAIVIAGSST